MASYIAVPMIIFELHDRQMFNFLTLTGNDPHEYSSVHSMSIDETAGRIVGIFISTQQGRLHCVWTQRSISGVFTPMWSPLWRPVFVISFMVRLIRLNLSLIAQKKSSFWEL